MKASPETNRARRPAEIPQRKQRNFEPLYHSVYDGRERLGHYIRIAPRRYAAYDAHNRLLGKFGSKAAAFAAVGRKNSFREGRGFDCGGAQ
jgi:hypothetical protein